MHIVLPHILTLRCNRGHSLQFMNIINLLLNTFVTATIQWLTAETKLDYVLESRWIKNWSEANDYCATQYGTTLATIRNDDDAQKLLDLLLDDDAYNSDMFNWAWIGLNDIETEGEWVWASGWECDGECSALDWWIDGYPNDWNGGDGAHCGYTSYHNTATDISNVIGDTDCGKWAGCICDIYSTETAEPVVEPTGKTLLSSALRTPTFCWIESCLVLRD